MPFFYKKQLGQLVADDLAYSYRAYIENNLYYLPHLVFGFIGLMQDYGIQMILTNGGPGYSTYVPGWYMYRLAFTSGRYGYACSIGTVLFIVIFAVTLIAFKLMHYGPFAKKTEE